jgi:hypothetical protein
MNLLLNYERCGSRSRRRKIHGKGHSRIAFGGQDSFEIDRRDLLLKCAIPLFLPTLKCPGPHEQSANDHDNYPQPTRRHDLDQRIPHPDILDLPYADNAEIRMHEIPLFLLCFFPPQATSALSTKVVRTLRLARDGCPDTKTSGR